MQTGFVLNIFITFVIKVAVKLSEEFKRARSITNKEKAKHLPNWADTFLYKEFLAQLWKLGDFSCVIRLKEKENDTLHQNFHHVARTSDSN